MNNFSDKDKEKVIEFLNFVAMKSEFSQLKVQDMIKFYGLISFMQKELIPKIDSHILEIKNIIQPEKKEQSKRKKGE